MFETLLIIGAFALGIIILGLKVAFRYFMVSLVFFLFGQEVANNVIWGCVLIWFIVSWVIAGGRD